MDSSSSRKVYQEKKIDDTTSMCLFDSKGNFLYANEAFYKSQKTTPSFYKNMTPRKLHELKLIDKCILDTVLETKSPVTDIQTVKNAKGAIIKKQLVSIYPILDNNHNIKNAIAYYRDVNELNEKLSSLNRPSTKVTPDKMIIAESPEMKYLYQRASRIASTDSTVLITGETGTGKEVLAKFIHKMSKRASHDMIVVDCTSLPPSLIESELFGYEKGSFTGASIAKKGLIESADNTTLFLDEINSMPLAAQGKLLRCIEERNVTRIGAVKAKPVNFRLIVATNANLYECVQKGTFRSDLFYRLNVIPLNIPPLRDHPEDIVPLINYFLSYFMKKYALQTRFSDSVYNDLISRPWPGNIRELRNVVERLLILGESSYVEPPNTNVNFPSENHPNDSLEHPTPDKLSKSEKEKEEIIHALKVSNGHRQQAADYLHISRRTLQYRLKKYGLL